MQTIELYGTQYELASTLRVAYMVQGQHNHQPYAEVFKGVGDMNVEDQIGIIYCAFICANPMMKQEWSRQKFQDYYLDNLNLKDLMVQLQELIKAITGGDEDAEESQETTDTSGN